MTWILQLFWIVAFGTGKMSVAFLLLRLLGPSAFWRKCFLRVNIVLTFISNALAAIFTFSSAIRHERFGKVLKTFREQDVGILKPIRLFDLRWAYRRLLTFVFRGMLTVSGYNCFLDICLALLPCTFVWHPTLRLGRKLQLGITLGLGIL